MPKNTTNHPVDQHSSENPSFFLNEHSACGVIMRVDLEPSHAVVSDALKKLNEVEYRSGYNDVTGESDGAGIRFYGLPTAFFNKKIKAQEFISPTGEVFSEALSDDTPYALGQYFLPTASTELERAKRLIEDSVQAQGLAVVGWRDLNTPSSVDVAVLSEKALEKKPSIWQAIIQKNPTGAVDLSSKTTFEQAVLRAALDIYHEAREQAIAINILSESSESIVYKGMVRPSELGLFYRDLQDKDFTASRFIVHSRFATNTDPQWSNAQPCVFFWAHNGELNSAPTNAEEMRHELNANAQSFKGIYPNAKLSDSMQFDADLANQIANKGISLVEAFVRLMPPMMSPNYSEDVNAMLQCFQFERTPYNGPAFAVAGYQGYFIAKLDAVGLRPSRWAMVMTQDGSRQFYAFSDDMLELSPGDTVLQRGHLEPGGMLVITPEGEVLDTKAALEWVCEQYNAHEANYFRQLRDATLLPPFAPIHDEVVVPDPLSELALSELHRALFSLGWDHELVEKVLRPMAEQGMERVAAMGDDTNPLHSTAMPAHIAYFFHQLFAQVSAPPLDSVNELDNFSLATSLGPVLTAVPNAKKLMLDSPFLKVYELAWIEMHPAIKTHVLDTCFESEPSAEPTGSLKEAIKQLLIKAEALAQEGGILVLSDKQIATNRLVIPDIIAVAAVRQHLGNKHLIRNVSIVCDSCAVASPHHASTLLALGANAVYPRGAYAKIKDMYGEDYLIKAKNFHHALEKCLLKTMGKMGITDVNNYVNSHLVAALGLDLLADEPHDLALEPTLAGIFPSIYSPLKGINLSHVALSVFIRYHQAHDEDNDFRLMPPSGYYIPKKEGIKHGYGPVVINAFTEWLKTEEINAVLGRMHNILERKGRPGFVRDVSLFTPEKGFLDPLKKDETEPRGYYPTAYLEGFKPSRAFKKMMKEIDDYRDRHPTSIRDYFHLKEKPRLLGVEEASSSSLQTQESIRKTLFAGSMSQGALTVADPQKPHQLGAHETLTRGMNAVGANSASGEGGEAPSDLRERLTSTRSKQIASGRFGVSAMQIICADEVEIKVAQGAKPGEGGQLPGMKVSVRFAAQRGGLPGTPFISPPPHHDIYSIEDLGQLIYDIKSINPNAQVAVKLVASQGIGTIAVGVAKAGADVINVAGHSGGTGAAQQSSIKHTGLPVELGLAEVDKALRKTRLRDLVKLRASGGFKTAEEVILMTLLGGDLYELGTTAMLTLGCKMQRTCNQSCQPGVATDAHLFKGNQLNTERFFVNLAALIQERLQELGVGCLQELRGRTDLLEVIDPHMAEQYDFSAILDRANLPQPLSQGERIQANERRLKSLVRLKEDGLVERIRLFFNENPDGVFQSERLDLTTQDRSFSARISGQFAKHLEAHPDAKVILNTQGNSGQSFGFVLPKGVHIHHLGSVQDGCGKSMSGGELIITTPHCREDYRSDANTIAGNVMCYGASGGKTFVNGVAGHRFAILCKGAELVVEGAGDLAFEYMTSGTGLVLGKVGKGLGASSSGGIIFVYDRDHGLTHSNAVRVATAEEASAYALAIQGMLKAHWEKTHSVKAGELLASFDPADYKVLIPKALDTIKTLAEIINVIRTYQLREAPITVGMQVWLEQKTLALVHELKHEENAEKQVQELRTLLGSTTRHVFSGAVKKELLQLTQSWLTKKMMPKRPENMGEDFDLDLDLLMHKSFSTPSLESFATEEEGVAIHARKIRKVRSVGERLSGIHGDLDEFLLDTLRYIDAYVSELSHDAKGCSGCRAQSCAGGDEVNTGCPSGKQVNTINATLQRLGPIQEGRLSSSQWRILREAFAIQIKESPFISYTGAACPAPCQDACTETIPDKGQPNPKRDGKLTGEAVHIKDIEYHLYQIGRAMGWFDGKKEFSETDVIALFGGEAGKRMNYDAVMQTFQPPFRLVEKKAVGKKLTIIGSGPAAMQMAYEALRDGVEVDMYEKSDKPGGLLVDGIPAHKFDKSYIMEDFAYLMSMGLVLHLHSEVVYDKAKNGFFVKGDDALRPIAHGNDEHHHVAVCIGAGAPVGLDPAIVPPSHEQKIVQAIDLLKAKNDIALALKDDPSLDKETLIKERLGEKDPRGKKIIVIGGGDTAQDVVRWVARYFNLEKDESRGELKVLVRGMPTPDERGIWDSYPAPSKTKTKENVLKITEVEYIQGDTLHSVVLDRIEVQEGTDKLIVHVSDIQYKYQGDIESDADLQKLDALLPRELKPKEAPVQREPIHGVDMVICALGFQSKESLPLVQTIEEAQLTNVSFAGDTAGVKPKIIVGAQASGHDTYQNRIKDMLGLSHSHPVSKPVTPNTALATYSLFSARGGAESAAHRESFSFPNSSAR